MRFCLLLLAWATAAMAASAPNLLFQPGDRWTAVGDSITQNGSYHTWIQIYYATRFPDRTGDFANAGISGDTADGAVRRFDWDIAPTHPSVATVMFGMNDVERSLYAPNAPESARVQRPERLTRYATALETLVRRLEEQHCRIQFVTPTPFDEGAAISAPNAPGVSAALESCAQIMRRIAAEHGLPVLDLQTPMASWVAERQHHEPGFTFTGGDRVHPTPLVHLAMAYWILRAQVAPAIVSAVGIDALALHVTQAINGRVSDLARQGDTLSFTVEATALPWPVTRDPLVSFVQDLNVETLQVTGLPAGSYAVTINDAKIGEWTQAELARGIALGDNQETPQYRQALRVREVLERKADLERQLRVVAQVDHWLGFTPQKRPAPPLLQEQVEHWRDHSNVGPNAAYRQSLVRRYLEALSKGDEIRTEIAGLEQASRRLRQPVPLHYQITSESTRPTP